MQEKKSDKGTIKLFRTGIILGLIMTYITYGTVLIGVVPLLFEIGIWTLPFICIGAIRELL